MALGAPDSRTLRNTNFPDLFAIHTDDNFYNEPTLELTSVSIDGNLLVELIVAASQRRIDVSAVQVTKSQIVGDVDFGRVAIASIDVRLLLADSEIVTSPPGAGRGSMLLQTNNFVPAGGHRFRRDVRIRDVRASQINISDNTFDGQFVLDSTVLDAWLSGNGAKFARGMSLSSVTASRVSFSNASVNTAQAMLWENVKAVNVDISGIVADSGRLLNVTTETFNASGVHFSGQLEIKDGVIGKPSDSLIDNYEYAPFDFSNARIGALRVESVLPAGIDLAGVWSGGMLVEAGGTAPPSINQSPGCGTAASRINVRGAIVDGWLDVRRTGGLSLDLSQTRATHLSANLEYADADEGPCVHVAGLRAPFQYWPGTLPAPEPWRFDQSSPSDLQAFRADLEKAVGKPKADAWYRRARRANPRGWFELWDRWINGGLLSYGTETIPRGLAVIAIAWGLLFVFVARRADAIAMPPGSFWDSSRFARAFAYVLFGVQSLTPLTLTELKVRPGSRWRRVPVELAVAVSRVVGTVIVGGILVSWSGYR